MSELHRFLFEGLPVRGSLVRLTNDWRDVLKRRTDANDEFPAPVRALLGEMAAAGVLMQSSIKFNGTLLLQVYGDGPVKLAVAEVGPELSFRVTAKVVGEMPAEPRLDTLLNVHGQGRCSITLDPKDRMRGQQPYQGVVALHGDQREPLHRLSEVLEHYMLQSEQLDTRLVLAANDDVAAGLLIQRLPVQGSGNLGEARNEDEIGINEGFNRIAHLTATLTAEELLTLDVETLLRRLYWEEQLARYQPEQPHFACTCSRQRVSRMLLSLGQPEADDIVAEQGQVEVACEFCGMKYGFDRVDVAELFRQQGAQTPGSSTIN